MEHSDGSVENQSADRNVPSGGRVHEVLEWDKDSIRNWTRACWCHLLAKGLAVFCPPPEDLTEGKYKHNGLICVS